MSKRGHTEEQILWALHQAEGGTRISDLCREHGISEATYYVWKKKSPGLGLSERASSGSCVRRTRSSSGWWRICRWTCTLPQEIVPKKAVRPRHRRDLWRWTQAVFVVSELPAQDSKRREV